MRLHVVSLPHTEVTQAYNQCAYTGKVRKFTTMMHELGHEVFLYSSGDNEASCTEHVQVFTKRKQENYFKNFDWWKKAEWYKVSWDSTQPFWSDFNLAVAGKIIQRYEAGDIVCLTTGIPHQYLINGLRSFYPGIPIVESGIGYEGIVDDTFHVFESYAWMHCIYGMFGPAKFDGRFYDTVIPNFFDVKDFPEHQYGGDPYFLFMSRMVPRKGYEIAIEATRRAGAKLIIAGTGGDRPEYDHVEYVGFADVHRRGELMANAVGLLCPTLYIEPFGGVVCEAMMAGTPVITTDFGAFTETVDHGVNGFRCHTMAEFTQALEGCRSMTPADHRDIRSNAINRWSTEVVAEQYADYFARLSGLKTRGGFYEYTTS